MLARLGGIPICANGHRCMTNDRKLQVLNRETCDYFMLGGRKLGWIVFLRLPLLVILTWLSHYQRMVASCELMVFTDLDGTLIDHETYSHAAALPALGALRDLSAGLVLASSKTAPEVSALRQEIGAELWPAIVENGAGALPPFVTQCPDAGQYDAVRSALDAVPLDLRALFCGFGDVSTDRVAQMTGLTPKAAVLAQQRSFSEPGIWSGTAAQKQSFLDALSEEGIVAQQGGRFLTLSFGRNKVDQMRTIIAAYEPRYTIALGDAPNDIAMLEYADIGIVVANPAHPTLPHLKTEDAGRIVRTQQAGPAGWNTAVFDAIARLELQ